MPLGGAAEMRHVAIDAEHPCYERQRPVVFARIAVDCDGERSRVQLSDTQRRRARASVSNARMYCPSDVRTSTIFVDRRRSALTVRSSRNGAATDNSCRECEFVDPALDRWRSGALQARVDEWEPQLLCHTTLAWARCARSKIAAHSP